MIIISATGIATGGRVSGAAIRGGHSPGRGIGRKTLDYHSWQTNSQIEVMKTKLAASICAAFISTSLLVSAPSKATEEVDELLTRARNTEPNVQNGRTLFREYCVECHGAQGQGDAKRKIPVIANQRQAYIIKQFADLHEGERAAPPMHGILKQEALDDMQAWVDVAAYVNTLPPVTKVATGNGKYVPLGEAMFREQCTSCHGDDARGDEDGFVPSLRNQHYPYLLAQIDELGAGHRTNVDEELIRFLNSLARDEKQGLADYLSRMKGKTRDLTWLRENGVPGD
jgi:cytochrome c553